MAEEVLEGAVEDEVAAGFAVTGAEIEDLVGGAHDAGLVLDHDDGVAGVAEFFEDADETVGVARMQTDGRFVEHEERVDETGAEASGQVNALGFAARKGAGGAVKGQIAEADLIEELETGEHLLEGEPERVGDGGVCAATRTSFARARARG